MLRAPLCASASAPLGGRALDQHHRRAAFRLAVLAQHAPGLEIQQQAALGRGLDAGDAPRERPRHGKVVRVAGDGALVRRRCESQARSGAVSGGQRRRDQGDAGQSRRRRAEAGGQRVIRLEVAVLAQLRRRFRLLPLRVERAGGQVVHACRHVRDGRSRLGQRQRLVGIAGQQKRRRPREHGVSPQRRPAQHVVQHRRRFFLRARPVERRGQRQRAPRQRMLLLMKRRIGGQRPGLVDEIVDLLVDDGSAALGDERRPLGDGPLQVAQIALDLADVSQRVVLLDLDSIGDHAVAQRLAVEEGRVGVARGRVGPVAWHQRHPAVVLGAGYHSHRAARAHARAVPAHQDVARLEVSRRDRLVEALGVLGFDRQQLGRTDRARVPPPGGRRVREILLDVGDDPAALLDLFPGDLLQSLPACIARRRGDWLVGDAAAALQRRRRCPPGAHPDQQGHDDEEADAPFHVTRR